MMIIIIIIIITPYTIPAMISTRTRTLFYWPFTKLSALWNSDFGFDSVYVTLLTTAPVWPSGKAGKAGKRKDLGSIPLRLSFLFKSCGLWTRSCDFVPHNE